MSGLVIIGALRVPVPGRTLLGSGFSHHDGAQQRREAVHDAIMQNKDFRRKIGYHLRMAKAEFFNTVPFEFQLYRGEHKFPRTKVMTTLECGQANKRFAEDFYKRLDKEAPGAKKQVLWHWQMVDKAKFKQALRDYINLHAGDTSEERLARKANKENQEKQTLG